LLQNKSFRLFFLQRSQASIPKRQKNSETWHSGWPPVLGFLDQQRHHSILGQWLWRSTDLEKEISVAGNSASIQIEGYIWIVMNSFSTAVVAIVAQNYGAGKKDNIKKALWMSLPFFDRTRPWLWVESPFWPISLIRDFLDRKRIRSGASSPQAALDAYNSAMEVGKERLMLIGLTYFLDGWMDNTSGFCRGLGHPNTPTIITFLAVTVFRLVFILTAWTYVPYLHTLALALVDLANLLGFGGGELLLLRPFLYQESLQGNRQPNRGFGFKRRASKPESLKRFRKSFRSIHCPKK
jgi:hypothetical protein